MIGRLPIRLRVAVAFAVTTALALAALGVFVHYRIEATLDARTWSSLTAQLDSLTSEPAARRAGAASATAGEFVAQVLTADGSLVATSPQVEGALVTADQVPAPGGPPVRIYRQVRPVGEDEAEPLLLLAQRRGDQVLVAGTSNEEAEEALDGVRTQFLIGGPLALLVASAMGYLVAGSAMKPIERMRTRAAAISAASSDDRLPLPATRDEIHRLGETLNAMLDRLSAGLQRERRFVAEASHELRTPLALLRTELDLALSARRSADELRAALLSASEEVDRLTRLTEDLLLLATSDEDRLEPPRADFDLGPLLTEVAQRFSTTAEEQGRTVGVTGSFPLAMRGNRGHLDRALSNVVDNALRHGSGDVELVATRHDDMVSVRVMDQGAGLPADFQGSAFDRFSRLSGARTEGGRGLGLAIVHALVTEHRGTVSMGRSADGRTAVTLELPDGLTGRGPTGSP